MIYSLFPICSFNIPETFFETRNKDLVPDSLFPIYSFYISETFIQIRNKKLVPGSGFSVTYVYMVLLYISSSIQYLQANNVKICVSLNA